MSARMFTLEERKLAVRRLQGNMTGVESKKFKRSQFIEAVTDVKIWIYMMMGAALYVTNGGVTAFGAQIVKSFGYSSLKTILMLTPGGATTAVSIYVTGLIASRWRNSRTLLIPITCMPVMVGAIVIWKYNWSHRGPLLVGFRCAVRPTLKSLNSKCSGTHQESKYCYTHFQLAVKLIKYKTFSAAAIFIGYNVGNIVAPYLIDTRTRAQHYPKAWISIIVVMVFSSVASLVLRAMYIIENRRRDGLREGSEGVQDEKRDAADEAAWSDLTDKKNPYFRYVY
ncbi:hypothetical protein FRC12_002942 [Ceratobasidium sp. 428]|nr:hypothetical protein FRC12_002942 [Ceratobasidium sp. 428]